MYYSIPGVRKAELLHRDVDYSDITALAEANDRYPRARAQQQQQQHQQEEGTTTTETEAKVSRSSRISFESHSLADEDVSEQDLLEIDAYLDAMVLSLRSRRR